MTNWYIDFSATNDGDGTTAAQAGSPAGVGAFKTIVGKTFISGDKVWFRRAGTLTLAATLTIATVNVQYIGWPVPSGSTAAGADGTASTQDDEDYATRPASGTSNGWDSDSVGTYPTISFNFTTSAFQIAMSAGAATSPNLNQQFKRLKLNQTGAGSTASTSMTVTTPVIFKYMQFVSAQIGNGIFVQLLHSYGNTRLDWCGFSGQGATNLLSTATAGGSMQNYDCYFAKTANSATGQSMLNLGNCWSSETVRAKMTQTDAASTSICCIKINAAATVLHTIIDCTLDVSAATAHGEYTIIATSIGNLIRGMKLKGNVSFAASWVGYPASFAYIIQPFSVAAGALDIIGANPGLIAYIASLQPKTGNTNDITIAQGTLVTIGDFRPLAGTAITPAASKFPGAYSADYGHVANAWRHDGLRAVLTKTTAHLRTGGEAFSIKCVQTDNTAPTFYFAEYGIPGLETVFCSLVSGANTVTIYGVSTTYTVAPTQNDIWFEVSYLDQATGEHRANISSRAGDVTGTNILALTTDSSTWTGDATATVKFKLVLSITTGQACLCPVRIRYKGFDASGYTYLDPKPVVT